MTIKPHGLRRSVFGMVALALTVVGAVPALQANVAHATAQAQSRFIKMSSSTPSDTGVTYQVGFNVATTGNIQGVVVDFCANSPILGDSGGCTTTGNLSGFTIGASPSVAQSGLGTTGTWATTGSSAHTLIYSNSSGTSVAAAAPVTLTISNVTNPSTTGTFYARIATYATSSAATAYTSTAPGSYVDYGGIALSTANLVTITAKVMETLMFCVSLAAPTAGCAGVSQPAMTLGHGTPPALNNSARDTATAYTQVSTNAMSGAVVRMENSNACGGLSTNGGSTCPIGPANSGNATTGGAIAPGTAEFGLSVTPGSGFTAAAPYNAGGAYGMDMTAGTGVTSTYGSTIASCTAPVSSINNTLTFAASAATTTQAGIYTANMNLIATGTF